MGEVPDVASVDDALSDVPDADAVTPAFIQLKDRVVRASNKGWGAESSYLLSVPLSTVCAAE